MGRVKSPSSYTNGSSPGADLISFQHFNNAYLNAFTLFPCVVFRECSPLLTCMYVGFKHIASEHDTSIDLRREYESALILLSARRKKE